jgi:hypothetical protein
MYADNSLENVVLKDVIAKKLSGLLGDLRWWPTWSVRATWPEAHCGALYELVCLARGRIPVHSTGESGSACFYRSVNRIYRQSY